MAGFFVASILDKVFKALSEMSFHDFSLSKTTCF